MGYKNDKKIKADLDEIDEQIIELISRNGRMPNTEIAERLHVSESTVRRRINRLINEDFIKIVTIRNPDRFSQFTTAIIGISCKSESVQIIERYLTKCKETRYVGYATGKWDIVIEAFFKDSEHLLSFVIELGQYEGVTDIETSVILRVAKFTYEWEIGKLLD